MRPETAGSKFRCESSWERELQARGFHAVAGVDEVGRGALFGPVVAAAVILSPGRPIRGLNDSKLLEPERREVLAARIRERAVSWAVAAVDAATIDSVNIYQASRMAMRMAVASIVDKVYRDACMQVWDKVFPEYGLAEHKGYATPEHRRAIREHGLTPLHRLSYEPVRAYSVFPLESDLQMDLFETAAGS